MKNDTPRRRRTGGRTTGTGQRPAAEGERIAKKIARAGICSRRQAETLIAERRVTVDGQVIESPALNVTDAQIVAIDGETLRTPEPVRLFRLHKPTGVVSTARDPDGRRTITDLLPPELPRLMTIGRLDINSEGLLLLTNDGELKRRLELPSTGWLRRYRVRVYGDLDEQALKALESGIEIDGVRYGSIMARLDSRRGANAWLSVGLREGKNREIRRVLDHLGLQVSRLIRIAYGPFQLGSLQPRDVDELTGKVVREQLGGKLLDGLIVPIREQDREQTIREVRP
ncbi:MAG: rRNA pseudouridine synthase [Geminicoccaceae bacterium]|nr:rRNA pseudouridine synthase [Geminicoccaceae bacterium]